MILAMRKMFAIEIASSMQYRVNAYLFAFSGMIQLLVTLAVWSAVITAHGSNIGGFGVPEVRGYFVTTTIIGFITTSWAGYIFFNDVRMGNLSVMLMRPIHPVWQAFAQVNAFKIFMVSVTVPLAIGVGLLYDAKFDGSHAEHLLAAVATAISLFMVFIFNYLMGIPAFWVTDIRAFWRAYWAISSFLGGGWIPLAMMPGSMRSIVPWLPFWAEIGFPAELAMGRLTHQQIVEGFATQLVWIVVFVLAFRILWKMGIKRYAAVGA